MEEQSPQHQREVSSPPTEVALKPQRPEQQHAENSLQPPPRKRRRTVLSCLECRSRKLKCDRQLPCARCVQSGHASTCAYATSSDEVALNNRTPRPRNPNKVAAAAAVSDAKDGASRSNGDSSSTATLTGYQAGSHLNLPLPRPQGPAPSYGPLPGWGSGQRKRPETGQRPEPVQGEAAWLARQPRPFYERSDNSGQYLTLEETLLARVSGQLEQLQQRVKELETVNGSPGPLRAGMSPDIPRPFGTLNDREPIPSMRTADSPALPRSSNSADPFLSNINTWPANSNKQHPSSSSNLANPRHGQMYSPATTIAASPGAVAYLPGVSAQPPSQQVNNGLQPALPPISSLSTRPDGPAAMSRAASGSKDVSSIDVGCPFARGMEHRTAPSLENRSHISRHYFGPTAPGNQWKHSDGVREFIKGAIKKTPELLQVRSKIRSVKHRLLEKRHTHTTPTFHELTALLPSEEVTMVLAKTYIRESESIYRIVHVPTFWKQFGMLAAYLSGRVPDTADVTDEIREDREDFVVLLLLAIAVVYPMPTEEQIGIPLGLEYRHVPAYRIIETCKDWLSARSYKRQQLVHFQIHCLIFLARRTNEIKTKERWTEAGTLLRLGMSFGLHRDPCRSRASTAFECEMRRRLWASMMEFEIQACIDRGSASLLLPGHWDCRPPANLHDEDFDMCSQILPESRPIEEFTRCSYLCMSADSLLLRLDLLNNINSLENVPIYDVTLEYDDKLSQALRKIPDWGYQHVDYLSSDTTQNRLLASSFVKLQILQFFVHIHHPFSSQTDEKLEYRLARMHSIKACFSMIEQCDKDPDSIAMHVFRHDAHRAGLTLCYNLVPLQNEHKDNRIHSELIASRLNILGKTIDFGERRARHLPLDTAKFWSLSAALGHMQTASSPDNTEKYQLEFAERIIKLHKHLADRYQTPQGYSKPPSELDERNYSPPKTVHNNSRPSDEIGSAGGGGGGTSVSASVPPDGTPALTLQQMTPASSLSNTSPHEVSLPGVNSGPPMGVGSGTSGNTGNGTALQQQQQGYPAKSYLGPLYNASEYGDSRGNSVTADGHLVADTDQFFDPLLDPADLTTWGFEDVFEF